MSKLRQLEKKKDGSHQDQFSSKCPKPNSDDKIGSVLALLRYPGAGIEAQLHVGVQGSLSFPVSFSLSPILSLVGFTFR